MKEVIAYQVVLMKDQEIPFAQKVQELINEGWYPYGSASMIYAGNLELAQPMVKYNSLEYLLPLFYKPI